MRLIRTALGCLALLTATTSFSQTPLYDINTIQKLEIYFSQSNWDYMMDTSKAGAQGYIMADWIKINGVQLDSVGVKYKGNSSYDASKVKNPLHLNLKKYKTQDYDGYNEIKLGNCYQDPSMIREPLAYAMLANYMDCPKSNFAQVYINGSYLGLYANDEDIDKAFLKEHFYSYSTSKDPFFKASHENPSPTTKCNLKYLGNDSSQYFPLYELKSDVGWNELVKLCDTVTNYPTHLGTAMDMDRAIWMLAFNNVTVNMDSYTGLLGQNYYLFKGTTNRFNPIVWDLNMALGGFPFAGSQSGGSGSLSVANMENLSPTLHGSDADWPLIKAVMNDATYKRMYIAHMRTIANEMFGSNGYQARAAQFQALVDTAVQSDVNMSFSYSQFQNALTSTTTVGSYIVPGVVSLMNARLIYLQTTPEFQAAPPAIAGVIAPVAGNNATISATITNANSSSVWLGYRFDKAHIFSKVLMYDDGAHNDGAANDNVYAASVNMDSSMIQYYIYAENNNAGIFSPERAEHEFYQLGFPTSVAAVNPRVSQSLLVYPNPARNIITIASGSTKQQAFSIRNTVGQVVSSGSFSRETTLPIGNFTNGMYYIHSGEQVQKLLIQH
jgi:hypothetical protein